MSRIVPMFKSDDVCDAFNYRPISLWSNFNRISLRRNVLFLPGAGSPLFLGETYLCKTYPDKTDTYPSETCTTQLIKSANRQDHVIPLLRVKAKVLPLNILYYNSVLTFMHHMETKEMHL